MLKRKKPEHDPLSDLKNEVILAVLEATKASKLKWRPQTFFAVDVYTAMWNGTLLKVEVDSKNISLRASVNGEEIGEIKVPASQEGYMRDLAYAVQRVETISSLNRMRALLQDHQ